LPKPKLVALTGHRSKKLDSHSTIDTLTCRWPRARTCLKSLTSLSDRFLRGLVRHRKVTIYSVVGTRWA